MPLVRFDITDYYSKNDIKKILDITQRLVVHSFKVPEHDRYQIVTIHKPDELLLEDTGLGFERSEKRISIQVFSRKRNVKDKLKFYKKLADDLKQYLSIDGEDVLISFFENGDADWSFAHGDAQFLNGSL